MKARISMLAIPLMMGVAFAQTSGSDQTKGSNTPPASGQTGSQSTATSGTPSETPSGKPAEMKTMTYRGTLVDLSCGGSQTSPTAAAPSTTPSTTSSTAPSTTPSEAGAAATTSSANRSAGEAANCPVTANSTQLGLKMDNGQVVRFDLVGNQRAQDELKNNKNWNKALSANKPLKVKISGVLQGDKLIVSSIH